MDSKQIRAELKKELGYNARQVSVRQSHGSIVFTVRDSSVDVEAVKTFGSRFESISRDYATGCILRGGNTFVNVRLSDAVKNEFKAAWLPALEAAAQKIEGNTLQPIEGTDYLIGNDGSPNNYTLWEKEGSATRFWGLDPIAIEIGMNAAKTEAIEATQEEETPEPETLDEITDQGAEEPEELNEYEQRQQQRRERYAELADKNEARSDAHYQRSHQLSDMIPFGQPILVGHHSESRHRNHIKRIHGEMGKSVEASNKAEYYRQKAESVGKGGISSDDPAALKKLREKLESMERGHAFMKAINKAWRAAGKPESENLEGWKKIAEHPEVKALGFEKIDELRQRQANTWFAGRAPFPSYSLSNNNANMKRVKDRIKELERKAEAPKAQDVSGDLDGTPYTLHENNALNRVQILFDGKPPAEIRATLKHNGFRWSPRNKAWQRHLNNAGRYAAQRALNLS